MSRYELRFSGSGGQGLITAGIIMAKAASLYEGNQAVQSQSYGPEARGGASKSEAADKYSHDLKEGGVLLVDSDLVKTLPKGNFKTVSIPIINTAKVDVGREIVANIVALGAMVALTKTISRENAEKAVLSSVPEAFIELNRKAFNIGYEKAMAN